MGAKDPDRVNPPPRPSDGLTLSAMHARRWLVTAHCPTCRARVHVDLAALIRLKGDDYVLWGRHARCKTWVRWSLDRRCEGRVTFLAQSCPNGSIVEMKMTREVREAIMRRDGLDPYPGYS